LEEKLLPAVIHELRRLAPERQTPATESTLRDLEGLQKRIATILTSRDQIYLATSHWGGLITTKDGKDPEEYSLDEYQRLIKSMMEVLWKTSPLLHISHRRLKRFMAEWGQRWPKGPRDSPGVFIFFQQWRPEEEVPDVHDIEYMLNHWLQKRGDISASCTQVIRSFGKYKSALEDMLQRPPEARPGQYIGTYLIWRQHMLAACCKCLSECYA